MEKKYGIYGIWIENELVYIGKTSCNFKKRFQEHKSGVNCQGGILYDEIREAKKRNKKVILKPICAFDKELEKFNSKELSCMEYSLITYLQPRLNQEGVVKKFRF